ncbi:MAG: hypothetical protein GC192_20000 [Bacteroidetes bacterium]|nr:hypothetical protein [Bacteroidota bacterium]
MKNFRILMVLLLSNLFLTYACQKDKAETTTDEKKILTSEETEFSNGWEMVNHYLQVIEEQQQKGGSVVFENGGNFVENPSKEWLINYFNHAGEKTDTIPCEYCYQFEYTASVATSNANYEAYSSSGTLLWTQTVNHPVGGWPANTLYVSDWLCDDYTTPPCIRVLWDMNTVSGTGICNQFRVRIRKPSGATQAITWINYPIPSTDNSTDLWCPTGEDCCNSIVLEQECVQDENGCWYTQMTPKFNGQPIIRGDVNSPCKTSWDILPPQSPTLGCPFPPTPWQNNNPILFPECTNWMVTIICGECTYQEMGIANCFAECGG